MNQLRSQLPIPAHFNLANADQIYSVDYATLEAQARAWRQLHSIPAGASDRKKVTLMIIDAMNTFCHPSFPLFVGGRTGRGAIDDNIRLAQFTYRNLANITNIAVTLDTHTVMQIFHPVFWVNDRGEHPAPFTNITVEDVETGRWMVNPAAAQLVNGNLAWLKNYALNYVRQLRDKGRYDLTIWPIHGMLGGVGYALSGIIEEAVFFHNIARASQTDFQIKGGNPLVEMYSVLGPEVTADHNGLPVAQKNTKFLQTLLSGDALIIGGQAKSHCVAWTIDDLLTEILAQDARLARQVYLLDDCSSPVVVPGVIDYTDAADAAYVRFAAAGMHVVSSTTPMSDWPDFLA